MSPPSKLLDRVRSAIRTRHYSRRTEEAYVTWIRRYILFHIDFARRQIVVRRGKGQKERMTMLPALVLRALTVHLARVKAMHDADLAEGFGRVVLPFALDRKYPNASLEWPWQYVFPAARIYRAADALSPARVGGAAGGHRGCAGRA